jgi:hypothetical protein
MSKKPLSIFASLFLIMLVMVMVLSGCGGIKPGIDDPDTETETETTSSATQTTHISVSSTSAPTPTATTSVQTTTASGPSIALDVELPAELETITSLYFKVIPGVPLSQIPRNTKWQWDFGDGSPLDTKVGLTEAYLTNAHSYAKNGDYKVTVSLIDTNTQKSLGTVTKGFIVSDIVSLKKANHFRLTMALSGYVSRTDSIASDYSMKYYDAELKTRDPWTFEWFGEWRQGSAGDWRGDEIKFKGTYERVADTETGQQTTYYTVSGKFLVNTDGIKLTEFYFYGTFDNPAYKGTQADWHYDYLLEFMPVPITKITGGASPKYTYHLKGYEAVYNQVSSISYYERLPDGKSYNWEPEEVEELADSDLLVTIDNLVMNN